MVPDAFCDGGVTVEVIGCNARATWFVMHNGERLPLLSVVLPADSLKMAAQQFAAAARLAVEDFGAVAGSA